MSSDIRFDHTFINSPKHKHYLFNIFSTSFKHCLNIVPIFSSPFEEVSEFQNWQDKDISKKPLSTYLNSFHKFHLHPPDLYPFTYIHFTNNTSPSLSLSIMSHSSSRPIYNLSLSPFDRIGREIAVSTGRTEGISYRWKNKLSLERSSNKRIREQRILMMESVQYPVSFVLCFPVIKLCCEREKERERRYFGIKFPDDQLPNRRGIIAFSRTWRGQFKLDKFK